MEARFRSFHRGGEVRRASVKATHAEGTRCIAAGVVLAAID
ncbi:MAG: hypothetical protein R3B96_20925 [Pirellulaceae bacterium]